MREDELSHECDMRPEDTANFEYAQWLRDAAQEIERLRSVIRVNGLRWGNTHAEIDKIVFPEALATRAGRTM